MRSAFSTLQSEALVVGEFDDQVSIWLAAHLSGDGDGIAQGAGRSLRRIGGQVDRKNQHRCKFETYDTLLHVFKICNGNACARQKKSLNLTFSNKVRQMRATTTAVRNCAERPSVIRAAG